MVLAYFLSLRVLVLIASIGIFCVVLTGSAAAKNSTSIDKPDSMTIVNEPENYYRIVTNLPHDYYSFFSESFSTEHLPMLIGVSLLSAAFYGSDFQTHRDIKIIAHKNETFQNFCNTAVFIGDGKYHIYFAGGLAVLGLATGNKREIKTACDITESLIASGLMVQGLKRVFGRESPVSASSKSGKWRPFPKPKLYQKNQPKYYSFPSGHITSISSTMAVLYNNYPEYNWLKPLGYGLIGATGVSLMTKDMHWLSDFPIGVFLGYTFGNIISRSVVAAEGNTVTEDAKVNIIPFYHNGYGFAMTLEF